MRINKLVSSKAPPWNFNLQYLMSIQNKKWMVYYINILFVSAVAVRQQKQQQRVKFITLIMSQDLFNTEILVNV